MKRVCVVTGGHLASTPRMLKAADAFHEAGYAVRVVCAEHVDWAVDAGNRLRSARAFCCDVVDWHPKTARWLFQISRVRYKANRCLSKLVSPARLGLELLASAACRVATELTAKVTAEPTDFIYAGTSGALAVGALAARKLGVPYALDLEDLHSAEQAADPEGDSANKLMAAIEQRILPGAAFLTASSQPITEAYEEKYRKRPITVNNVFTLPTRAPTFDRPSGEALRLYWFSQVVGPRRGLEDAIQAAGLLDVPIWLGLVGSNRDEYQMHLRDWASQCAKKLVLEFLGSRPTEQMVELAGQADVGLALEPRFSLNNDLALSNKLCTYLLAGIAVAATDTAGQRTVMRDLGKSGILYNPGDVEALAAGLKKWSESPSELLQAKQASWQAAKTRWHWEHPLERGALLAAVKQVFAGRGLPCAS